MPFTSVQGSTLFLVNHLYVKERRHALNDERHHGYGLALSQPRAKSYKLCIRSVVRLGLHLLIQVGWSRSPQGRSIMNVRREGCRQSLDRKSDLIIHRVFFSTPISRSTTLTTKVQQPLSFINITTISELHLVISGKSQRRYPQNAVGKRSL